MKNLGLIGIICALLLPPYTYALTCKEVLLRASEVLSHPRMITSSDHQIILNTVRRWKEKLGVGKIGNRIVVAFDLDATLIHSKSRLASEEWFFWQLKKVRKGDPDRVARTETELKAMLTEINRNAEIEFTQANMLEIIKALRAEGVEVLVLTARDPMYREVIIEQLKKMGIWEHLSLGVLMVGNKNKGEELLKFLRELGIKEDAIAFADDKEHNVTAVEEAMPDGTLFLGLRYSKMDSKIEDYNDLTIQRLAEQELIEYHSQSH